MPKISLSMILVFFEASVVYKSLTALQHNSESSHKALRTSFLVFSGPRSPSQKSSYEALYRLLFSLQGSVLDSVLVFGSVNTGILS